MTAEQQKIQKAAEEAIAEKPKKRVLSFSLDGRKYWIKRKLGNGRNQLVKFSPEKEFYYEIARMSIAACSEPEAVPVMALLRPDYMVTEDSGCTMKKFLDSGASEEEKEQMLYKAGAALASFHEAGIIHGRPALRDMTVKDGHVVFLDWENRFYSSKPSEQRAIDFLLLLQGICRENFPEEKTRAAAAEKGYLSVRGEKGKEEAVRFLRKHRTVGTLAKSLSCFHMADIESVAKLYRHFL